jgi:hypothetical protein
MDDDDDDEDWEDAEVGKVSRKTKTNSSLLITFFLFISII